MKRRRSSTSSSGEQADTKNAPSQPHPSKRTRRTSENNRSKSQISVRLQNADMLTKYRNKNPHIIIEMPKNKSNCMGNEIGDDDEIWLCEIPNSIDVEKLIGKSLKLGSKKSTIKITDETQLECVSSKFDQQNGGVYANAMSVVFQNDDAKLSVKNLKALGHMSIHKKIDGNQRETIELSPTVHHECTVFPESLRVRHPLFGNHFEDKIKLSKRIGQRLAEAAVETEAEMQTIDSGTFGGIRIKQEKEDNSNVNSRKKPAKESKSIDKSTNKSITIKTEKNKTSNGHDADLARIKQIFQQC